jgi:hypothetical protein
MKDRFNLEDEISSLYSLSEQLATLSEAIMEETLTIDETVNALEGLRVMLNIQTSKLHDTMCQCFNLDHYKETYE